LFTRPCAGFEPWLVEEEAPGAVLQQHHLEQAGVPFEQHIFKDAPHSFFDRTYEEWKDASARAWTLMLEFVRKHSSS